MPRIERPPQAIVEMTVNPTSLTDAQRKVIADRGIQWTVLNKRNPGGGMRVLLLVVGPSDDIIWLRNKLNQHGLEPIICGAFYGHSHEHAGYRIPGAPTDLSEWLSVAPDVEDPARLGEDPPVMIRPTAWGRNGAPLRVFAGWPSHTTALPPT